MKDVWEEIDENLMSFGDKTPPIIDRPAKVIMPRKYHTPPPIPIMAEFDRDVQTPAQSDPHRRDTQEIPVVLLKAMLSYERNRAKLL